jgi:hypothetical protein
MVCNVVYSFGSGIYSMGCASLEYVSSLPDRVGSFAQSCLQRAGEQSRLDEYSTSRWEELKNQFSVCLDWSLSAIRGVGQVFSRVITFVCNELEEGHLYLFDRPFHRGNARRAVELRGYDLQHCSRLSKNNKEIVLAAVTQNGQALRHASEALRGDRDVVLAALTNSPFSIDLASKGLQRDPEMILTVLRRYPAILSAERNQPNPLTANKEFMMRAVALIGVALGYASEELKADRDVVLAAVAQKGCALELASADLRDDEEVVRTAIAKQGFGFEYASQRLQANPVCIAACQAGALQHQAALARWVESRGS